MENNKYRIVDGRIVALIDIPEAGVKVGDLGGQVESEHNLSFWGGDTSWIDQDSVVTDRARVEDYAQIKNSILREHAYASGRAIVQESTLRDHSGVSGRARLTRSYLCDSGRACDDAVVIESTLAENASVQWDGHVEDVRLADAAYVSKNGFVTSRQHVMAIGPIGSEDRTIQFYRTKDGFGAVKVGCFRPATLDALAAHVENLHGDEHDERWKRYSPKPAEEMDRWYAEYMAAIALMRIREASWSK